MSKEVKQEGDFKMPPKKKRGRPKKLTNSAGDIKVDLTKEKKVEEAKEEEVVKVENVEEVKDIKEETTTEKAENEKEDQPIVELNVAQEEEYITESKSEPQQEYPENIEWDKDHIKIFTLDVQSNK